MQVSTRRLVTGSPLFSFRRALPAILPIFVKGAEWACESYDASPNRREDRWVAAGGTRPYGPWYDLLYRLECLSPSIHRHHRVSFACLVRKSLETLLPAAPSVLSCVVVDVFSSLSPALACIFLCILTHPFLIFSWFNILPASFPLTGTFLHVYSQCARRNIKCEYPLKSRRGQRSRHPRPEKDKDGEDQSSKRRLAPEAPTPSSSASAPTASDSA